MFLFGVNTIYCFLCTRIYTDMKNTVKKRSKLPIYCASERFLEFEEWYELFEDFINMELAEIGANREMDFDSEREFDKRHKNI